MKIMTCCCCNLYDTKHAGFPQANYKIARSLVTSSIISRVSVYHIIHVLT